MVWLVDASAQVGSVETESIGGIEAREEDAAGEEFHQLLMEWECCLPATMIAQPGGGGTFCSLAGRWKRLDYVGVPRSWLPGVVDAKVEVDVALAIGDRLDHAVPTVRVVVSTSLRTPGQGRAAWASRDALAVKEVREEIQRRSAAVPPPLPGWDVDTHEFFLGRLARQIWADCAA